MICARAPTGPGAVAMAMRRPVTPPMGAAARLTGGRPTSPPTPGTAAGAPVARRAVAASAPRYRRAAVAASAAGAADAPAASSSPFSLPLLDRDPALRPFEGHLTYRWHRYLACKREIEQAVGESGEGGGALSAFAGAYRDWGLRRVPGAVTLREWIPGASAVALIGDFNNWQPRDGLDWATRDEFGVWTLRLPDPGEDGGGGGGAPAVPHGSRYKLRVQSAAGGWWADRVSAWATYAVTPQGKMGATYDGVAWYPGEGERYQWRHPRPPPLPPAGAARGGEAAAPALRIYEAHVGMSSEREEVASYAHFADEVLPRIKAQGYNAVQLMAVQEHAYYASFGYHVTSPFAVSSRSGTPEDLKRLVDRAHALKIRVLLDVVHSHASRNEADGVAGFDLGGNSPDSGALVRTGDAGYHRLWDSRVYSYEQVETKRFLLANLKYFVEELGFDGFRFDGVTSMLYQHHGIGVGFTGSYGEYFGLGTDVEACVYLMLANEMLHGLPAEGGGAGAAADDARNNDAATSSAPPPPPDVLTIAEDVSGMPGLCAPVGEGGLGFDARLAMAAPDLWIRLLKHVPDEGWPVSEIVATLCGRRYGEGRVGTVGYSESHDQAMVGDKTVAMWLFGAEIYEGMSLLQQQQEGAPSSSPVVERGMALHKTISAATAALGGEARMTFMGNEFGHPEWIDFPTERNGWSHKFARRQWSLAERPDLRYSQLLAWDRALNAADDRHGFVGSPLQWVTVIDDARQLIVAERGPLVWVLNFSPHLSHGALRVPVPEPGKYRVVLDSDATCFGGHGRVPWKDYFSTPAGSDKGEGGEGGGGGEGGAEFYGRGQWLEVASPPRTAVAYVRVREEEVGTESGDGASEAIFPPAYGAREEEAGEKEEGKTEAAAPRAEEAVVAAAAARQEQQQQEGDGGAAAQAAKEAETAAAAPAPAPPKEAEKEAAEKNKNNDDDNDDDNKGPPEQRGDYIVFRF